MKKILLISILITSIYSCSSNKIDQKKIPISTILYFDDNNNEVSKSRYKQIYDSINYKYIRIDSAHHKKLVLRQERGKLKNKSLFEALLKKEITNLELDFNKPIVIVYYPGKDLCNSSGSTTKNSSIKGFKKLNNDIYKIAQTKPIYIYKNTKGLKKYGGISIWHKDPKGIIERLFFKYHYPCMSFITISNDGNYISHFGEFSKESILEATKIMN